MTNVETSMIAGGSRSSVAEVAPPASQAPWQLAVPGNVHMHDAGSLLLAGWRTVAEHRHVVQSRHGCAALPFDVMTLSEMMRQAVILLSHTAYGVEQTTAFVMQGIEVDLLRPTVVTGYGSAPVMDIMCHDLDRRGGRLRAMKVTVTFRDDAGIMATGLGELALLPDRTYRRIRGTAFPCAYSSFAPRMSAVSVGRDSEADVLLSPDPVEGWWLAVDTTNRSQFDHPTDHVPGMVLLEAALQAAACSAPGVDQSSLVARFNSYVEYSLPTRVRVLLQDDTIEVTFQQAGIEAATVTLSWGSL